MKNICKQLNDKYPQIYFALLDQQDNGNKAGGLNGF